MYKIVLDTNVVVSAIRNPNGKDAEILSLVLCEEVYLHYSAEILHEYEDVLSRPKHGLSKNTLDAFIADLVDIGFLISPDQSDMAIRDETDRNFYDVAKFSGALLITRDKDLLVLCEKFIVTVEDYMAEWERLTKLRRDSVFS